MNSSFIEPLEIHKHFGVKPVEGINVLGISKSHQGFKKYVITLSYKGVIKNVHFGHTQYQHYKDRSPLKLYKKLDHLDKDRRHSYLSRASKIRNKEGKLTCNDPFSPNRYAIIVLW